MENSSLRTFSFIGGSQDGNEIPVGEPHDIGTRLPLPLRGSPNKREIYELESDGQFHFRQYEDGITIDVFQKNLEKVKPVMERLSAALKDLDGIFADYGGWHGPLIIGSPEGTGSRWELRPKGSS